MRRIGGAYEAAFLARLGRDCQVLLALERHTLALLEEALFGFDGLGLA